MSPRRRDILVVLCGIAAVLVSAIGIAIQNAQQRAAWRLDRPDGTWTVVVPHWRPAPFTVDPVYTPDPDRLREI